MAIKVVNYGYQCYGYQSKGELKTTKFLGEFTLEFV